MNIEKIIINNYRQIRDLEITFDPNKPCIIKGVMGTGKTNFLNAINWCLYGDEPYLSKDSKNLPLINLNTVGEIQEGEKREVSIQIWIKLEDERSLIFERKQDFIIVDGENHHPSSIESSKFKAKISKDDNDYIIVDSEDAESYVDRFVPKDVRKFFFFDGERLDRYFKEATGQKIRRSIYKISQTSLLGRIEENLKKIKKEYEQEAGKSDVNVEFTRNLLNDVENSLNESKKILEENESQAESASKKIKELSAKVKDFPAVDKLKKNMDDLKSENVQKKKLMNEKLIEKQNYLFEYSKMIFLYPSIVKAMDTIREEKQAGNYPPTFDKSLIEEVLKNRKCRICGSEFEEGSEAEKNVKRVLSKIDLSTEVANKLQLMENPLNDYLEDIKKFDKKMKSITKEIERYKLDVQKNEKEISEIKNNLNGFNQDKVRQWYSELERYEKLYKENTEAAGIKKQKIKELTEDYGKLDKQIDEEISRNQKIQQIKFKIHFIQKAISTVNSSKIKVMD